MEFSKARMRLAAHEAAVDSLRLWIGFPGLTTAALDASLKQRAKAATVEERRQELVALLAVKPLSLRRTGLPSQVNGSLPESPINRC